MKRNKQCGVPTGRLKILVVSRSIGDRFFLEQLGERHHWDLWFTESPGDGFKLAARGHFDLILCDRDQPGYPWREVMDRLVSSAPRSCILLLSAVNEDYLWGDVLQRGGYNVLLRPLREKAVLCSIDAAVHFISPEAQFCSR